MIGYLPSMYQSFRRREAAVAALDIRASTPPTAAALLIRSSIIGGWDRLEGLWREWESWFVDVTETHTSLPAQPRRRALHPGRVCRPAADRRLLRRPAQPDPHWSEEPISIDRREFAGWRVNCGRVLLSLAALTIAPYAPWSS
ncbi:MAG TPA: hypothetical protein VG499_04500, partial [Actinomycetota bacterium]|nr:hypothetical protein [Actinomycetota bacterium]